MNKETLEEAAKRITDNNGYFGEFATTYENGVIAGINFQKQQDEAERMYSEEEVIKLLIYCKDRFRGPGLDDYTSDSEVKQWFEYHKKK